MNKRHIILKKTSFRCISNRQGGVDPRTPFCVRHCPLLLLIYINDTPNALLEKPRLYADDTCLIISSPTIEDLNSRFKAELHNSQIWMNLYKLSLNINKTYSPLISPKVCSYSADTSALLNTGKIQQVNEKIDS